MGWTSYHVSHDFNRKEECDNIVSYGGCYQVVQSKMVGSTYYAAVKKVTKYVGENENGGHIYEPIPESEQNVFGIVILTSVSNKYYTNFFYKEMSEDCGPCYYDCPKSILDKLSPTTNDYALTWREKCLEKAARKSRKAKGLNQIPIGGKIRIKIAENVYTLIKQSPRYQFKTDWWLVAEENQYFSKKKIPDDFVVLGDN